MKQHTLLWHLFQCRSIKQLLADNSVISEAFRKKLHFIRG